MRIPTTDNIGLGIGHIDEFEIDDAFTVFMSVIHQSHGYGYGKGCDHTPDKINFGEGQGRGSW